MQVESAEDMLDLVRWGLFKVFIGLNILLNQNPWEIINTFAYRL